MAWIWEEFVEAYLKNYKSTHLSILDVGGPSPMKGYFTKPGIWDYKSLNVHPPAEFVVSENPYDWQNVPTNSVDVIVSADTFEHVPYFWMTFFEMARVLKNNGIAFLHAPSATPEHPGLQPPGYSENKYTDCWRFYADGFSSLCKYIGFREIEVFTEWGRDRFQNSYLVMQKPDFSERELQALLTKGWFLKQTFAPDTTHYNNIHTLSGFDRAKHVSIISEISDNQVVFQNYENHAKEHDVEPYYHYKLAKIQAWKGKHADAISNYRLAIGKLEAHPERVHYKSYMDEAFDANLPSLYASLGECQINAGQIDDAIGSLKHCISIKPDFFEGPYHLITAYLRKSDFGMALEACNYLERISPVHASMRADEVRRAQRSPAAQ